MNIEKVATAFVVGVIGVATLTTIFGRSNAPKVFDAIGSAMSRTIMASLGAGADLR